MTRAAAMLLLIAITTSCVNHAEKSARFCRAVTPVLDTARDHELLSEEVAQDRADAVAEEMRHAEDGRRPVREAARELLEAYDDLVDLLGDDDTTEEELREKVEELDEARVDTRTACSASLNAGVGRG